MALPRRLARINRRVTNRVAGLLANRAPGFAVVVHKGRRSGREYRTPVNAFRDDDDFIFALTYGTESDWVKNIVAAGGCAIEYRGETLELRDPQVEHDPKARWAPLGVRQVLRVLDAPYYVRLYPSNGRNDTVE